MSMVCFDDIMGYYITAVGVGLYVCPCMCVCWIKRSLYLTGFVEMIYLTRLLYVISVLAFEVLSGKVRRLFQVNTVEC